MEHVLYFLQFEVKVEMIKIINIYSVFMMRVITLPIVEIKTIPKFHDSC